MRYTLTNGTPVQVRKITADGVTTTNPTDAQIDAVGAGYPLVTAPRPDTTDTQTATTSYALEGGQIVQHWEVSDISQAEIDARHNAEIDAQMAELNAAFEAWKTSPAIVYSGHVYQPSWLAEYYVPMLQDESSFPRSVRDYGGEAVTFTLEAFRDFTVVMGAEIQNKVDEFWDALRVLAAQKVGA